jgi:hypothetical protein
MDQSQSSIHFVFRPLSIIVFWIRFWDGCFPILCLEIRLTSLNSAGTLIKWPSMANHVCTFSTTFLVWRLGLPHLFSFTWIAGAISVSHHIMAFRGQHNNLFRAAICHSGTAIPVGSESIIFSIIIQLEAVLFSQIINFESWFLTDFFCLGIFQSYLMVPVNKLLIISPNS